MSYRRRHTFLQTLFCIGDHKLINRIGIASSLVILAFGLKYLWYKQHLGCWLLQHCRVSCFCLLSHHIDTLTRSYIITLSSTLGTRPITNLVSDKHQNSYCCQLLLISSSSITSSSTWPGGQLYFLILDDHSLFVDDHRATIRVLTRIWSRADTQRARVTAK